MEDRFMKMFQKKYQAFSFIYSILNIIQYCYTFHDIVTLDGSCRWNPVALQNVLAFDMMCVNSRSNVPSVEVNVPCIDNISHNDFLLVEIIY